jgi:signal peptidase I
MTQQTIHQPTVERQEPAMPAKPVPEKSVIRQYAEAFIIAIVLALVIRTFVVQAFKIPSGSMLPTLQIGDHILVNKFIYWFTDPQRGDIIVFKFPQDEGRDFIKRAIALPGEKVEVRGKQVYVSEKPLQEPYAAHLDHAIQESPFSPRDSFGPVVVPPGQLFMMGDNRDYSMDSRFWGFLDMKKIKGKAFIIYWSWDRDRFRPRWGRIGMVIR